MTDAERSAALDSIAEEIRGCTRCRLHETRTRAVPGEGNAATEVVFIGEGPGFNEDRQGRPFVGRAGALLERLLASVGWRRDDVFITNIVKCRPPENRDPEADEIAACAPYLRRQLEALDPALVVTLGRHSMGRFMPGARISAAHGTARPLDPVTGARDALVFAMYHPAAALRAPDVERQSFEDMAAVPATLLAARERRERAASGSGVDAAGTDRAVGAVVVPEIAPEAAAAFLAESPPEVEALVASALLAPAPMSGPSIQALPVNFASDAPTGEAPADDQLTLF